MIYCDMFNKERESLKRYRNLAAIGLVSLGISFLLNQGTYISPTVSTFVGPLPTPTDQETPCAEIKDYFFRESRNTKCVSEDLSIIFIDQYTHGSVKHKGIKMTVEQERFIYKLYQQMAVYWNKLYGTSFDFPLYVFVTDVNDTINLDGKDPDDYSGAFFNYDAESLVASCVIGISGATLPYEFFLTPDKPIPFPMDEEYFNALAGVQIHEGRHCEGEGHGGEDRFWDEAIRQREIGIVDLDAKTKPLWAIRGFEKWQELFLQKDHPIQGSR